MANTFDFHQTTYSVGDRILVHQKIEEEGKTRTQIFDGIIIAIKGRDSGKSFTVRKIGAGSVGVERIIPISSPLISKIEIKSKGQVRRSKLYYLRDRVGRSALRVKEAPKNHAPKKESKPKTRSKSRTTSQKASSK